MEKYNGKIILGALELCDLPHLSISSLNVRVDTGAATSSLHVDNITEFYKEGAPWVSFDIHPDIHDVAQVVRREARVNSIKKVKSSSATKEKRYEIETEIKLAGQKWSIAITLTDRSQMTYLMLLGRQAMQGLFLVDPEREYIASSKRT